MQKTKWLLVVAMLSGVTNLVAFDWGERDVDRYLVETLDSVKTTMAICIQHGDVATAEKVDQIFKERHKLCTWIKGMLAANILSLVTECDKKCAEVVAAFVTQSLPYAKSSNPNLIDFATECEVHVKACCEQIRVINEWWHAWVLKRRQIEQRFLLQLQVRPEQRLVSPRPLGRSLSFGATRLCNSSPMMPAPSPSPRDPCPSPTGQPCSSPFDGIPRGT